MNKGIQKWKNNNNNKKQNKKKTYVSLLILRSVDVD